jgi:maleate isomerase
MKYVGASRVVVISPYKSNNHIVDYLAERGIASVKSVALGLESADYGNVTPEVWSEVAREHDTSTADAIFLSCAATRQIEAIHLLEPKLRKPVINSNQAVLWACLRRLGEKIGDATPTKPLGQLFEVYA